MDEMKLSNYHYARSNGGHLYHALSGGTRTAICGYRPKSTRARSMVDRSCWVEWRVDCWRGVLCPRCIAQLKRRGDWTE